MGREWTLGARVRFSRPLIRSTKYTGSASGLIRDKRWTPSPDDRVRDGVIVGRRTLRNGRIHPGEYGLELDISDTLTAYMVAHDLHRAPVLVRPEDIRMGWHEPAVQVCPFDCDGCHDEDCPCDRSGCAGSETGPLH